MRRPADAAQWRGTLVLVERGRLAVDCARGGSRVFDVGCLLPLGELPLQALRNPGRLPVRLLAVRRRTDPADPARGR